ncbi:MAG: hypothetical protein KDD33_13030 [Bdellovibrionales bacterium]|nr:hypothetical protein [Bdellovibrionales bacterium]
MDKSSVQNKPKQKSINTTLSVGVEVREKLVSRLNEINKQSFGGNITARQYIEFLMSLETTENIKILLKSSIRGKDINELYKKRFFEKFNTQSEDDYYSFIWSDNFSKFKKENKDVLELF